MNSNLQKIDHVVVLMLVIVRSIICRVAGLFGQRRQKVNGVAGKELSNPIPAFEKPPRD